MLMAQFWYTWKRIHSCELFWIQRIHQTSFIFIFIQVFNLSFKSIASAAPIPFPNSRHPFQVCKNSWFNSTRNYKALFKACFKDSSIVLFSRGILKEESKLCSWFKLYQKGIFKLCRNKFKMNQVCKIAPKFHCINLQVNWNSLFKITRKLIYTLQVSKKLKSQVHNVTNS